MVACQVKGCRNRSSRQLNKRLFVIPNPDKERSRCSKWLRILGSDKFNIETYVHDRSRVVCEDHFEPECFEEDLRARLMGYPPKKKLKPDAIPTIPLIVRPKTDKRHSTSKTCSTSSERKKQKLDTTKNSNNKDCSAVIKEETSFEELFIPPLFPSRLPLNEEEEEDDDDEPEFELKSNEDYHVHPTDVNLSTESTSHLSTLQEQDHEIGPYCEQAGISEADITSDFQNVSLLPTIKNGLVLEIHDHLHTMQIYSSSFLRATLKRLNDCPKANDWSVGSFIKKLVERRDRIQPETRKGAKELQLLHEEEFLLIRKRTPSKRPETRREKTLTKNLEVAKKQRAETWKCLDILERDMQRSRQENAALSKKVTELATENKDLRATVFCLEEQCLQLQQFRRNTEEKCKHFPEMKKIIEDLGDKTS